ncbi:MAG TPA: VOC family protein [Polyangia bacterium]|nr:VOC family protein [Polyangia bacterium]
MTRFCRVQLRTTDVPAARLFYRALLEDEGADIVPLPVDAIARGARPHWLGHLGVEDAEATAQAFTARGATRLGPSRVAADGGTIAILRDPGGAVVALSTGSATQARADVVWQSLNTADLPGVTAAYCAVFGWQLTETLDLGALGRQQQFAWSAGGPSVGAMADIAGRAGVHPHWLFHFRVAALEPALAAVRAAGGVALDPITLPGGARVAVCDDPQGAAFALQEETSRAVRG